MPVLSLNTLMNQYKVAFGVATSVTASDTIPTGLNKVLGAVATLQDDASAGVATASVALSPTAGSIVVKTWAAAGTAAGTFAKKVTWVAFGY